MVDSQTTQRAAFVPPGAPDSIGWHWICIADHTPFPAKWDRDHWQMHGLYCDRYEAAERRYRYVAPCPARHGPQPIETAPKDGTVIDLWVDGRRAANCFWDAREWDPEIGGIWRQQYAEADASSFSVDGIPSHWMAVPELPE